MTDPSLIQFAWLDAEIYRDDNKKLLRTIRGMNSETMEFIDKDECLRFLGRGVADPRRFMFIVSGALGEKVVPDIQDRENILSVFVFCGWREKHEGWSRQFPKVKVVTTEEELLSTLKSEYDCHREK